MLEIAHDTQGWTKPLIRPFQNIEVHPFSSALNYAVECFEGMKAFKDIEGRVRLFRPELNMNRLRNSS